MESWIKLDHNFSPTIEYFAQKLSLPELVKLGDLHAVSLNDLLNSRHTNYNKEILRKGYMEKRVFFLKKEFKFFSTNNCYVSNSVDFTKMVSAFDSNITIFYVGDLYPIQKSWIEINPTTGETLFEFRARKTSLSHSFIKTSGLPEEWVGSFIRKCSPDQITGHRKTVLKALYKNKFAFFFLPKIVFLKGGFTYFISHEVDFDTYPQGASMFYILDDDTQKEVEKTHEEKERAFELKKFRKISLIAQNASREIEGEIVQPIEPPPPYETHVEGCSVPNPPSAPSAPSISIIN